MSFTRTGARAALGLGFLFGAVACRNAQPESPPPTPVAVTAAPHPAAPPAPPNAPASSYWVERTDRELATALSEACTTGLRSGKPVLLMFSAGWCKDCVLIHQASQRAPLANELANWEVVVADVGRFDRHDLFRSVFGVTGLAWWVATRPTDCNAMPHTWPRLREGLLEPASNPTPSSRVDALAGWLTEARAR